MGSRALHVPRASACTPSAAFGLVQATPLSELPWPEHVPAPLPSRAGSRGCLCWLTARCVSCRLGLQHGHLLPHDALL